MKNLLMPLLALFSTAAFAHSGHMHSEGVHGLLHAEHISILIGIVLIAAYYYLTQKK